MCVQSRELFKHLGDVITALETITEGDNGSLLPNGLFEATRYLIQIPGMLEKVQLMCPLDILCVDRTPGLTEAMAERIIDMMEALLTIFPRDLLLLLIKFRSCRGWEDDECHIMCEL